MAKQAAPLSLDDRADNLIKIHGDSVPIKDIALVVDGLVQGTTPSAEIDSVAGELRELLQFIGAAKTELLSMQPKSLTERDIPGAHDQLDAIVSATEETAGVIMDAADTIGELAGEVDEKASVKLMDVSTQLFEASSFQDLTGQRITKVTRTLKHLEERLGALAEAIGDDYVAPSEEEEIERDDAGEVVHSEDLLHGPQLEGEGNNQDEIDALLASFD